MTNQFGTAANAAVVDLPASRQVTNLQRTAVRQFPASSVPEEARRILLAFEDAQSARDQASYKTFVCGLMLCEQRDRIAGAQSFDRTKPEDSKFKFWLEKYCPQLAVRTAYAWMDYAERICLVQAKLAGPLQIPLSTALTAPEKELTPEALEWKQGLFEFMKGKTMKEAVAACAVDGDEPHRITRAYNGKYAKGAGSGGNRKNFPAFTAQKLRHITTFLGHKLTPVEQGKITASFDAAVQKWPRWMVERLAEMAKRELKLSEEERVGRTGK
jgi:hypothetical protein